mmetsp:Transcript_116950/g.342495  ORF Transcript_116950/g.342495 Transcript_116950/m.342495 type:complete len:199 (-) Transcript_116950:77-673(-)
MPSLRESASAPSLTHSSATGQRRALPARPCLYNNAPSSTTCLWATQLDTQSSDPFVSGQAREALTMTRTMLKGGTPHTVDSLSSTGTRWKTDMHAPYMARAAKLAAAQGVGPGNEDIRAFRLTCPSMNMKTSIGTARHYSIHFSETTPTSKIPAALVAKLPGAGNSRSLQGVGLSSLDNFRCPSSAPSASAVSQDLGG